jgi:uncharacterized protein YecE (DUF72 family)
MQRYFQTFDTVEVQQTFYDPPRAGTLSNWRVAAPPGFRFAMKAWQLITHPAGSPTYRRLRRTVAGLDEAGYFRPSATVRWAWDLTLEAAKALEADVILFQCPASFQPSQENLNNMRSFFCSIERGPFRLAWEPRGEWPLRVVDELCHELNLIHAVDPFVQSCVTGYAYYRLHGKGGYRYRYTDDDLDALLAFCLGHTFVYTYFNNVTMFDDALRLSRIVEGRKL